MCNHYRTLDDNGITHLCLSVAETFEGPPWKIFRDAWPKSEMPVIYEAGRRTLTTMRWGFWPFYLTDAAKPRLITNARDDSLFTKSLWRGAVKHGRCLVPADGFYEFKGPKGAKTSVLFHLVDNSPFFFAGLWSTDPVGGARGFALVTTKPNTLLEALPHDRMPVILDRAGAQAWIGNREMQPEAILKLCSPFPAEGMVCRDEPGRHIVAAEDAQGNLL